MKASLMFYPNTSKKSKKNGKVPLYARVCFKGLKAEERLNVQITEDILLKWDPMTMRFSDRTLTANKLLNSLDQRFEEFIYFNSTTIYSFNPRKILDHVLGKPEKKEQSVIEFVDEYFSKCVEKNSELATGTIRNYRKSINHLKRFLTIVNKKDMCFSELSRLFVSDFFQYLKSSDPLNKKEPMTMVSASSVMKSFRPIINAAVDKGVIEKNPFKEIKLKTRSPQRDRLNITQVKQLKDLDLSNFPTQRIYREIFLWSVFTGLANKDAMSLNDSNLEYKSDGTIKLSIKRVKTDILTESFLVSQAVDLLKFFSTLPDTKINGTLLPKRSNEKLNLQLKFIAGMAGIPIKLTSHIARHTFRQMLAESGIEDMGVIKRMMGQSWGGDIDEVYYSVTESRLLEAKNKFQKFLNQNL